MSLLVHSRPPATDGTVLEVTPESAGWRYVGFRVVRLAAGKAYTHREAGRGGGPPGGCGAGGGGAGGGAWVCVGAWGGGTPAGSLWKVGAAGGACGGGGRRRSIAPPIPTMRS